MNHEKTREEWRRRGIFEACVLTRDSDGPCGVCISGRHGSDALWAVCRFHSDCTPSTPHSPGRGRKTASLKMPTMMTIQVQVIHLSDLPSQNKLYINIKNVALEILQPWSNTSIEPDNRTGVCVTLLCYSDRCKIVFMPTQA